MKRDSMPNLTSIARYWATSEDLEDSFPNLRARYIGWAEPFCFKCGRLAPVADASDFSTWKDASGYLERAHLMDHARGGPETASNLVPLCSSCHLRMPSYGDRATALSWVGGNA